MTAAIAEQMAAAALMFLESLDPEQRAVAQWPFHDTAEREAWFYTPTDHGGLPLASMRPLQQQCAHRLLGTGLSLPGYVTAATIIGLDNVLDQIEGHIRNWGRERGRDPGAYYWRVFGDPAGSGPWSWRVGGHHVSVQHVVMAGEVLGSTPLFLGADPASSPLLGPHPLRPLAGVEDLARELVRGLDDEQLARARATRVAPSDIVGCNRAAYGVGEGDLPLPLPDVWRGRLPDPWDELAHTMQTNADAAAGITPSDLEAVRLTTEPRGIPAAALRDDQREVLVALLDLYADRLPEGLDMVERSKYAGARVDRVHFLWAGGMEPGEGYYYRAQADDLLVECDNTQRGANHIHTVWRDPSRDFGRDPLAEHYERGHGRA